MTQNLFIRHNIPLHSIPEYRQKPVLSAFLAVHTYLKFLRKNVKYCSCVFYIFTTAPEPKKPNQKRIQIYLFSRLLYFFSCVLFEYGLNSKYRSNSLPLIEKKTKKVEEKGGKRRRSNGRGGKSASSEFR